eukprot:763261-Hanusia_phi.AAC.1
MGGGRTLMPQQDIFRESADATEHRCVRERAVRPIIDLLLSSLMREHCRWNNAKLAPRSKKMALKPLPVSQQVFIVAVIRIHQSNFSSGLPRQRFCRITVRWRLWIAEHLTYDDSWKLTVPAEHEPGQKASRHFSCTTSSPSKFLLSTFHHVPCLFLPAFVRVSKLAMPALCLFPRLLTSFALSLISGQLLIQDFTKSYTYDFAPYIEIEVISGEHSLSN